MRAFAYCRVSTEEQGGDNHFSLEFQEESSRNRVKEKGWQLLKLRKDIASGKGIEGRPGYQELLQDMHEGRIDVVVVHKLDRLSRNVRDVYDFLELARANNVEFVSLTEGFDTTNPMGRAMLGIAAVFAQLTRETIAENVKNGLLQRAKSGQWNGGTMAPLGYDYSSEAGLTVNPDEAKTVQRIFDLYTDEKLSISRIARRLNQEGLPSRTGAQWTSSMIAKVLGNPVCVGRIRYDSVVAEGKHDAIISSEQFDVAQGLLKSRKVEGFHPRARTSGLLLGGIARCGYCGWRLNSHTKSGGGRRYRCTGNQKAGEGECKGFMKSADMVEEVVVSRIREIAESKAVQDLALAEVESLLEDTLAPVVEESERLLREQETLSKTFSRWAERLDRGLIDEEQFQERNEELMRRKHGTQQRLAEVEEALAKRESAAVGLDAVKSALRDFQALWEAGTQEERKELVRLLVERIEVTPVNVVLKMKFLPEEAVALPNRRGRPPKAV